MDESTERATRLWTLAQPNVAAFVASVIRDYRDRDDVLQDIAIAVIQSFESYDQKRPFTGWAIGVARNQIRSHFRKQKKDKLVFSDKTIANLETTFANPEDSRDLDFLHECMKEIQGRSREICKMRYHQNLKSAAIGEKIDMTANSVSKVLQRVRDQLRQCIQTKSATEGA